MRSRIGKLGTMAMVVAGTVLGCRGARPEPVSAGECAADLRAAFGLVERNYAGYADKVARFGAHAISRAQATALLKLDLQGPERCTELLKSWLEVFQEGHLQVQESVPSFGTAKPSRMPSFEILSDQATLIRVPSFTGPYREPIQRLVEQHRAEITTRPDLIIDLRGNMGGGDSAYRVLMDLVYSKPVPMRGVEALASQENIAGWQRLAEVLAEAPDVRAEVEQDIARMRQHEGGWADLAPDWVITRDTVLPQPARVALLIDVFVASSGEQFVLEALGSSKVRVFGQPTYGCLDYSNMVPHPLPSGERTLWVASSRSRRIPDQAIDATGIVPHVELDPSRFDGAGRTAALEEVLADLRASVGGE